MKKQTIMALAMVAFLAFPLLAEPPTRQVNPDTKLHKFSTVVEKKRPELDEETKRLIAEYRRNPTEANRAALRRQVEKRYDAVVARKKAKLEELKRTARDKSKVDEMQVIVDEMLRDREARIEQSMTRFADPRLKPNARNAKDGFLPVIGGPKNLSIAYTPVTNEEYAAFLKATERKPPKDWTNGAYPAGKGKHPVVNVTYEGKRPFSPSLNTLPDVVHYVRNHQQEDYGHELFTQENRVLAGNPVAICRQRPSPRRVLPGAGPGGKELL